MTGKRLLLTGASGFVGRHIVTAAAKAGFEVHGVSRVSQAGDEKTDVRWHEIDLLTEGAASSLVARVQPTHLIHSAWETTQGSYWTNPVNERWVTATADLAHAFASVGGLRFMVIGSAAEYDWSHGVMIEDVTPTRPNTLYGASKLAAHRRVQEIAVATGFSAVTGRLFFAYGPHENVERLIPYVSCKLAQDEPALLSRGRQIRDFMHVEDVASALIVLLESTATGAVNIGSGEPVRLAEIAAILGEASHRSEKLQFGARPERPDDVPILVPDIQRLRALGWQPRIALNTGLLDTYAWWASRVRKACRPMPSTAQ